MQRTLPLLYISKVYVCLIFWNLSTILKWSTSKHHMMHKDALAFPDGCISVSGFVGRELVLPGILINLPVLFTWGKICLLNQYWITEQCFCYCSWKYFMTSIHHKSEKKVWSINLNIIFWSQTESMKNWLYGSGMTVHLLICFVLPLIYTKVNVNLSILDWTLRHSPYPIWAQPMFVRSPPICSKTLAIHGLPH